MILLLFWHSIWSFECDFVFNSVILHSILSFFLQWNCVNRSSFKNQAVSKQAAALFFANSFYFFLLLSLSLITFRDSSRKANICWTTDESLTTPFVFELWLKVGVLVLVLSDFQITCKKSTTILTRQDCFFFFNSYSSPGIEPVMSCICF